MNKVIIWGTGKNLQRLKRWYSLTFDDVAAFVDKACPAGDDQVFEGKPLIRPERIGLYPDAMILISSTLYYDDIYRELTLKWGIPKDKIMHMGVYYGQRLGKKNTVSYAQLLSKNVILAGEDKLVHDVEQFFYELKVAAAICVSKDRMDDGVPELETELAACSQAARGGLAIICSFDPALVKRIECGLSAASIDEYIYINELTGVLDEPEAFLMATRYAKKKAIVLGTPMEISLLLTRNPHLNAEQTIVLESADPHEAEQEIWRRCLGKIEGHVFIVAIQGIDLLIAMKEAFQKKGMVFGEDFFFYESDIHEISWKYPQYTLRELLEQTMKDLPRYDLFCDETALALMGCNDGVFRGCCDFIGIEFGNICFSSLENITGGIAARILHVSTVNKTYSFCHPMCQCLDHSRTVRGRLERRFVPMHAAGDYNYDFHYDSSCNLQCKSCRNHLILKPEGHPKVLDLVHNEMVASLPLMKRITFGLGEVFYSKYLKKVIFEADTPDRICFISNGLLFNQKNWLKIREKYKTRVFSFSIDAATEATYKILRGGNFATLMRNMEMAGRLREAGEIQHLTFNFVVQRDNFREMPAFVAFSKSNHADCVNFTRILDKDTYDTDAFRAVDVCNPENPLFSELQRILQGPVMCDPIVLLSKNIQIN